MSEANPPVPTPESELQAPYHASSLVVPPRPDEVCFSLTEVEFQILSEGETNESRAGRDLCTGACVTALLGFVSIIATVEWETVWKERRLLPFIACAIFLFIAGGSGVGWWIFQRRLTRTTTDSACSRLKTRIDSFFKKTGQRPS